MATHSRKEIKGGRLLESIALGQRRGDEDSGKRNKVKSNGYFRAGINTILYFGEVHYKRSRWFFQVSVPPVKIEFGDTNVSVLALFMGM